MDLQNYFDRADAWRHFPGYRLEPRVDIFFSLYLKEVLQIHSEADVLDAVLPEFPLHRGMLYGDGAASPNKSVKVDFVLFSADFQKVFFVELKTDGNSRREEQDEYLKTAAGLPFARILEGLLKIVWATDTKYIQKYLHLVKALECLGLLLVPPEVYQLAFPKPRVGITAALKNIRFTSKSESMAVQVVFVQPRLDGSDDTISFELFNILVSGHDDPLSRAFSRYLEDWTNGAGERRPPDCSII